MPIEFVWIVVIVSIIFSLVFLISSIAAKEYYITFGSTLVLIASLSCFFIWNFCATSTDIELPAQLKTFDGPNGSRFQIVGWNDRGKNPQIKKLNIFFKDDANIVAIERQWQYLWFFKTETFFREKNNGN